MGHPADLDSPIWAIRAGDLISSIIVMPLLVSV
jgi:hypothetical protein